MVAIWNMACKCKAFDQQSSVSTSKRLKGIRAEGLGCRGLGLWGLLDTATVFGLQGGLYFPKACSKLNDSSVWWTPWHLDDPESLSPKNM